MVWAFCVCTYLLKQPSAASAAVAEKRKRRSKSFNEHINPFPFLSRVLFDGIRYYISPPLLSLRLLIRFLLSGLFLILAVAIR